VSLHHSYNSKKGRQFYGAGSVDGTVASKNIPVKSQPAFSFTKMIH
jgi:hypothetical protein